MSCSSRPDQGRVKVLGHSAQCTRGTHTQQGMCGTPAHRPNQVERINHLILFFLPTLPGMGDGTPGKMHEARAPSRALLVRLVFLLEPTLPGRGDGTPGTAHVRHVHPAGHCAGTPGRMAGPQSRTGRPRTSACRSPLQQRQKSNKLG